MHYTLEECMHFKKRKIIIIIIKGVHRKQPRKNSCNLRRERIRMELYLSILIYAKKNSRSSPLKNQSPSRDSLKMINSEAVWYGLLPFHRERHLWGWDTRLSTNLQENKRGDRIVDLSIGDPSSRTLRSTSPHCPMACKGRSMTWDTPVQCGEY